MSIDDYDGFPKVENPGEGLYAATREIKKAMEKLNTLNNDEKELTAQIREEKKRLKKRIKFLTGVQFKTSDEIHTEIKSNGRTQADLYDYEVSR